MCAWGGLAVVPPTSQSDRRHAKELGGGSFSDHLRSIVPGTHHNTTLRDPCSLESVFDWLRRNRHARADVSLVAQWIGELASVRAGQGAAVPYDQLPITQGTASLIADALAAMPLYAVNERDGTEVADRFEVLEQPSPDEHRADTVHKIAQSMFWTGNAEALKGPLDPSTGAITAITVLNPDSVSPDIDPEDDLHIVGWNINGRPFPRTAINLWKLNDDPRRGPTGESPLKRCATALDTYGWAYRYLADFFAQGGNPSTVLKSKIELSPAKITELADEWVAARKQTRPAFLPNFLDLEVPQSTGELTAVIEVLGFAAAEVARALNLPVSLVNAPVQGYSLQYSNVGDEFRRWLATSLGTTWVARIERGFTQLLPMGVAARMDPSQLYRPDLYPEVSAGSTAGEIAVLGQPAVLPAVSPSELMP